SYLHSFPTRRSSDLVTILERPHAAIEILDSIQCFNGHHFQFINSSTHSSLPSLGGFWEYANGDTSIGFEPINAEYDEPGYYKIRSEEHTSELQSREN